jgi:diketogulonate reductase-like aldo/keto reductase
MFDCAQFYGNEHFLGTAIKESGIPRDQFFLISKIWTDKIYEGEEAIRAQVR